MSDAQPLDPPQELSLTTMAKVVLKRRGLIVLLSLGCAVVAGIAGLLSSRTWTASATFMPQARQSPAAGLSGLANQLGISVPAGDAGQGPGFYADFIASRTILGALADTAFRIRGDTGMVRRTLADAYDIRGHTPLLRRDVLIRELSARIIAQPILKTGVVKLRITAPSPDLAYQMTLFVLDQLNRFNLMTRQSQAGAERRFMEGRLEATGAELRQAEDRLQAFLQRNRNFRNSPELVFEEERLTRDVQVRQQVNSSLRQAYEQARVEEVRATPVITVVVAPELPARPDPRGVAVTTLVALIGGGLLGIMLAFLLAALAREREEKPDEMLAVEGEWRAALQDFRRPWRLFRHP